MITIKVKGFNKTIRELKVIGDKRIPMALEAALYKSSDYVLTELKNNTPIDTGNLKDSMRASVVPEALMAQIGPDEEEAPYAKFVEFGHHTRSGSFVKGQLFIMQTALETTRGINEIFNDAIKLAVR
jgi:HK97 gp10 family phage protein